MMVAISYGKKERSSPMHRGRGLGRHCELPKEGAMLSALRTPTLCSESLLKHERCAELVEVRRCRAPFDWFRVADDFIKQGQSDA